MNAVTGMRLYLSIPLNLFLLLSGTVYAETNPNTILGHSSANLLQTPTDKISYAIGIDIGHNFKAQGLLLNPQPLIQGLQDGLSGNKPFMTPEEMQTELTHFQQSLINKHNTELQQASKTNQETGAVYLATNKTKPGVTTLPDGLQYKIIKTGEGQLPTDKDLVTVNYTGTFINGKVFDSSYTHGKPVTFPVTDVIPGWTEALKMMKPGAVWEITVPPALGYGSKGAGPIGPDQVLLFKIELIAVNPANNATKN